MLYKECDEYRFPTTSKQAGSAKNSNKDSKDLADKYSKKNHEKATSKQDSSTKGTMKDPKDLHEKESKKYS